MSDSSIIEARLGALENRLSEVQARLQKSESTQTFKIEAGKVFIEEAPIKNAAISAASDECIASNPSLRRANMTTAGRTNKRRGSLEFKDLPISIQNIAIQVFADKYSQSITLFFEQEEEPAKALARDIRDAFTEFYALAEFSSSQHGSNLSQA